ncbi:ATP-dependent helicase [Priestia megaterium]
MKNIKSLAWNPIDITLEKNALKSVVSNKNVAVVAGPGAGKTELLAQRAAFLLETGACPPPRKILAISFKADAADNLRKRVHLRCGNDLARRFESKTYDSFAKGLLDRFRLGLGEEYRPNSDYEIITDWQDVKEIGVINHNLELENKVWKQLVDKALPSFSLPFVESDGIPSIIVSMWKTLLHGSEKSNSALTFKMITRLTEYLLKTNPLLISALQETYSHVFLDEFQDTTDIQYDLLKTIFLDSNVILTAVGDNKQRIMGWAGALDNSFDFFRKDFNAEQVGLLMNHRSTPRLVEIQNVISGRIDVGAIEVTPSHKWSNDLDGSCEIFKFSNCENEALYLAYQLYDWIKKDNLQPKDFCILVKQTEQQYAGKIIKELSKLGIRSRLEKEYQDLLTEELTQVLLSMIELTTSTGAAESYQFIFDLYLQLRNIQYFKTELIYKANNELDEFIADLILDLDNIKSVSDLQLIFKKILGFIGESEMIARFPQYAKRERLEHLTFKIALLLWKEYSEATVWSEALAMFKGEKSMPIMTIHKSKGLEYDTVIFIGVEDGAFWNFRNQSEEDKKSLFVAMSRAKKRMIFTYTDWRETNKFGDVRLRKQSINNITELYNILDEAGVATIQLEELWSPVTKRDL